MILNCTPEVSQATDSSEKKKNKKKTLPFLPLPFESGNEARLLTGSFKNKVAPWKGHFCLVTLSASS